MADTILIWFNPDIDGYESGSYGDYRSISITSDNQDRFEVIYEFCKETIDVLDKILISLNTVHRISSPLNL